MVTSAVVWLLPLWLAGSVAGAADAAPGATAASPQRVVARAGVHQSFGRMVFDWPQPVGHRARISGTRLTIEFDRPMQTVLGSLRRNLSGYIIRIALAPDGRSITAALKGAYTLRSFARGNRVVVDLMRRDGESAVAPLSDAQTSVAAATAPRDRGDTAKRTGSRPIPLRRRTAAKPSPDTGAVAQKARVIVRGGRHTGYGRLVFEWDSAVGYRIDRKGRTVSVRFDRPAEVDVAALRRNLPPGIGSAKAYSTAKGLNITLVVARHARLRHFRDGNSVVLDVFRPSAAAARPERDRAKPKRAPQPAAANAAEQRPPAASSPALKAVNMTAAPSRRTRELARKRRIARFIQQQAPLDARLTVEATRREDEISIRFDWREPVAAAVYRRGTVMWVVFDRPRRIDVASVQAVGNLLLESVEQLSVPDYSVLRFAMLAPYHISAQRDGAAWILEIGPKAKPPGRTVPGEIRYGGAAGTRFVLTAKGAEHAIRLHDPDVGDVAYVVPLATPSLGQTSNRKFPDFELLPSVQGLAFRQISETLSVAVDQGRVIITRPGGLRITREADLAKRRSAKNRKLLDFDAWLIGPKEKFQDIEYKLIHRITTSRGVLRNAARLGLTRFYVAHGMGAEALGVLRALMRESPTIIQDPKVRALRGLAAYQLGHFADAKSDLGHPALRREPEIHPWLAGIAAARGDWAGAYRLFEDTDPVVQSYPPDMATTFTLLAAEAALSIKDIDSAASRLRVLEEALVTKAQLDQVTYLRGHLAKLSGELPKALALWEAVAVIGDRPARAKAAFARVNAMLEDQSIKPAEAIEELEALRFAWRNDVFEFDLLHRLGQLHAENKNYRNALLTFRRAATYYSGIKGAQALTGEMSEVFKKFYEHGDADKLPPISALGIFQEFRELTPSGEEGNKLIARLADRLIEVDLLTQAGDLLEYQVVHRLADHAKAEVGLRVAQIRLMDNAPEKSLEALAKSVVADLPAQLERQRSHAKAMALSRQNKPDEALKLISSDAGDEADELRADILWSAKRWRRASRILARLTGALSTEKLDRKSARQLLRRAVALALSKDAVGIGFLRERFGTAMKKSAYAEAFLAVVGKRPVDTDDYRILARKASELDVFLAFRRGELAQKRKSPPAVN